MNTAEEAFNERHKRFDINDDPFTIQRISGNICATFEWRLVNRITDTKQQPLRNLLECVPFEDLQKKLKSAGFGVDLDLSDRIVEYAQPSVVINHYHEAAQESISSLVLSLPFTVVLIDNDRPDITTRAYVLRTRTDELALQEHHQGYRPGLPGVSKQSPGGSEVLRCTLRCYGGRDPIETGTLAQRIKEALESAYKHP